MNPNVGLDAEVRAAAFRLLLDTGRPVTAADVAGATGTGADLAEIEAALRRLESAGRIRADPTGAVFGSAGLSVTEDRHEIELDGRRFWTWCAYDILGIFGALRAGGRAVSPSPGGGTIELRFERGRPVNSSAVLFRPDAELVDCCENVYAQWCPNSNLFADAMQASAWAEANAISGRVMSLVEASELGTVDWADVTYGGNRGRGAHARRD